MLTLIFDAAATRFGQDYHPERPARLIQAEAYLLDKRPEWIWLKPRLATEQEVLRVHRPTTSNGFGSRSILTMILLTIPELKNTLDVLPERRSVR